MANEIRALLYYRRCGWCDGQGAYTTYLGLPEAEESLVECEKCGGVGYVCHRRANTLIDFIERGIDGSEKIRGSCMGCDHMIFPPCSNLCFCSKDLVKSDNWNKNCQSYEVREER